MHLYFVLHLLSTLRHFVLSCVISLVFLTIPIPTPAVLHSPQRMPLQTFSYCIHLDPRCHTELTQQQGTGQVQKSRHCPTPRRPPQGYNPEIILLWLTCNLAPYSIVVLLPVEYAMTLFGDTGCVRSGDEGAAAVAAAKAA